MFRKIALIAVPALTLIVALGTDNSASQAFAKGGSMGNRSRMSNFRYGFNRDFRHFNRYRWDYGFGYVAPVVEVPVVDAPVVAPICPSCEVAPVCTTCEQVVSPVEVVTPGYVSSWGYGKYGKFHQPPHRFQPLARGARK